MPKYEAFGPDAEVLGQNVLAFVECTNSDNIRPFLERHGLDEIDPERWYPMQDFLDVLNDMENEVGGAAALDFVSIGLQLIETAVFPPEVDELSLEEIMLGWNESYQLNNRGAHIGDFDTELVVDKHLKITTRIPYPDDYNYGVFYGAAKRWLPENTPFTVYYDEEAPRRDIDGSQSTIVHIEWE